MECDIEKFNNVEVSHVECGLAKEAGTVPEFGLGGLVECGSEKFKKKKRKCEASHVQCGPAEEARNAPEFGLAGRRSSAECGFSEKSATGRVDLPECGFADEMQEKELDRIEHGLAEKTGSGTECGMTDKRREKS